MLQENILFANRYQLIKLLGRGGFSEVWLAKDNYTHLEIAIKVYAPGQGMDQDGLKDFCGELASVYDLNHSNLLKPQHVDTWNNMPYLIMAYCPAGSCVKQVGKMSETELWKLIHNVASGLAYLHDKEVIHQDIKPDNILVDAEGNYLITDFGISTRARSTLRKSVVGGNVSGGTTAYMGPERFSRQPAPTKASDIWSFGAMAFELLEGVTPFGEIGGGMQKTGAEIPFINAPVSDALKFVIFKMLSKETWDRPTASTLVEWVNNPSTIQIDYSLLNPEETTSVLSPQSQTQSTPITNTTNETIQSEGRATQRFGSIEPPENMSSMMSCSSEKKDTTPILEKDCTKNKAKTKKILFVLFGIVIFAVLLVCIIPYKSESTKNIESDLQIIKEGKIYAQASIVGGYIYQNKQFELKIERFGSSSIYYTIEGADCIGEEYISVIEVQTTADYVSQYSPQYSDVEVYNYMPMSNSTSITINFYIDICGEDIKLNSFTFPVEQMNISNPIRWNLELKSNDKNLDLIFKATIDAGWHLYGHELPKDGPIETNINFNHVEGVELVGKFKPISEGITQFDEIYGLNLTSYETEAIFIQTIEIIDKNWSIAGSVSFMCYDAESILMGTPFDFSIGTK